MTSIRRALAVIALAAVAASCRCALDEGQGSPASSSSSTSSASAAPATPADVEAAKAALLDYFVALSAKDCATIEAMASPAMTHENCQRELKEAEEHGETLDRIVGAQPDGRTPQDVIVTASVVIGGKPREAIFRMVREGGRWKMRR